MRARRTIFVMSVPDPRHTLARLASAALAGARVWFGPPADAATLPPGAAQLSVDEATTLYAAPGPFTPAQHELLALTAASAHPHAERAPVERDLLEAISQGRPLPEILARLVHRIESLCPGLIGSIQLLDDSGEFLAAGIAPNLPPAYCAAIERIPLGPVEGSCGTAAYRRQPVIVEDVLTDPLWAARRHLAPLGGFRACWSYPILAGPGQILGTFALYYREVRRPADAELRLLAEMSDLAAVAISSWRAQERTDRALDQLRRQLSEIPSLLWRSDADGRCDSASQAWCDFTGLPLAETLGAGWLAAVHPEDRPAVAAAFAHALAARVPFESELRLRRADGQWRWVCGYGQAYHAADGRFLGYTNSWIDVTERKTSETHLALATQALGLGIWEWNISAGTVQWDRHCAATVGLPADDTHGLVTAWHERVHPADAARVDAELARHLRQEAPFWESEYRLLTTNRGYRWVYARGGVTAWSGSRAIRMAGTIIDIHERRMTELALAESEETLRSVLESSPASILTVDTALQLTFATHPENAPPLGSPAGECVEPPYRALLEQTIAEVLSTRAIRTLELEARCCRGTIEWFSITIGPLYQNRTVHGAILSAIEISERRRAEQEARIHRERFELAVRGSKASLWDQDLLTRRVNYSPRFLEMTGFAAEEVGNSVGFWESRIHPEDRDRVLEAFRRHLETDALYDIEYRLATKSGEYRWFNTRGQAVRDAHGVPYRVAGSTIDVTERRRAEQAVRDSEARYRLLFEASPQPMFVYDPRDGRILAANAAASQLYGYPAAELATLPVAALIANPQGPLHRRRDGALLEVEYREHDIEFAGAAARLALVTDMTRQRALEAQLRQAQKMEAFGQLAGGIAHDFNNLLTVINGYGKLVSRKLAAQPEIQRDVELVRAAGERATALTRQLLAFARRQLVQPQPVDLAALLDQCRLILKPLLGGGITLTIRSAPGLPAVEADPSQLEQVLLNLAVNARDAMPAGGAFTIELDLAPSGRFLRLTVSDTGHGIPADALPHIFEPFYTTKPIGQGTGLGLSTVYGIITQAHGHITVESEPGAGARFLIDLPVLDAAPLAPSPEPAAPQTTSVPGATILVADDERDVCHFIRQVLTAHGYHVLEAPDGAAAVELLHQPGAAIDLLLTDLVMPRLGGLDAAEAVRSLAPGVPVIYMSGFAAELPAPAGAALLPKPFTEEALLAAVAQALAASSRGPGQGDT